MFLTMHRGKTLLWGSILLVGLVALGGYVIARRSSSQRGQTPPPPGEAFVGEFLPWSEVNRIFPKYAQATIIDYETRQQFKVQRRAGSTHADVQPLSTADTRIMKAIYGQWSWKRRAVLVVLKDGRKIAASMNGMPHGAGAIPNNNFNGHFCLHFRDSRTHASRQQDLAHQVMIWKAAGQFDQQLQSKPPEEVIPVYFTLLNQSDEGLASRLINKPPGSSELAPIPKIQAIRLDRIEAVSPESFQVELQVVFVGSSKVFKKKTRLDMVPGPPYWRIQGDSVNSLWGPASWSPDQATRIFNDEEDPELPVTNS